jgi:hypothetical protein
MADDFGSIGKNVQPDTGIKRKADDDKGASREYLKVFETLSPQLLNAYGESKFMKMEDKAVWEEFCKPLKSGAPYMTEFCDAKVDRRGIGANRWIMSLVQWVKYQISEEGKKHNDLILKADVCTELYKEIAMVLPALEYCLAPKKAKEGSGASALRSQVSTVEKVSERDPAELDKHAKVLYDWLDKDKRSYVRMMVAFLAEGGLSFNAVAYHRSARCFRYYGNLARTPDKPEVSLDEFQECIKVRHRMGSRGNELTADGITSVDVTPP